MMFIDFERFTNVHLFFFQVNLRKEVKFGVRSATVPSHTVFKYLLKLATLRMCIETDIWFRKNACV